MANTDYNCMTINLLPQGGWNSVGSETFNVGLYYQRSLFSVFIASFDVQTNSNKFSIDLQKGQTGNNGNVTIYV